MKVERQNFIHQSSSRFHSVNAKASSYRFSNMDKDPYLTDYVKENVRKDTEK